ncbi:MAG: hypothetical protein NW223_02845 [Hyphomicrobiaceae bacterium]|nr:hypothetical protein [Hyphomicrobiaceae bacterium]
MSPRIRKSRVHVGRRARACVATLTAAALLSADLGAFAARAAPPLTRADYEACQARDEAGFRAAVAQLTRKGLEAGIAGVDYKAVVQEAWRKGSVDDVIDRLVDKAEAEVRSESSWSTLLQSLASKEKSQELATAVTERVYRSPEMRKAIETLSESVGREIGRRIELAALDTAEPAGQCIEAYLGPRYGSTIARVVATGAGREYRIDPAKGMAGVSTGQLIAEGSGGIAGTVVLVLRRQLSNMAARIGQRVVGAILSRLVSVVAGGVGAVLIAKDIWDFRYGVLPIIAEEMKSKDTKEKVRTELAATIADQIGDSVKDISDKTADRIVEIWAEFRRAHAKVVELSEKHPAFKRYVDQVKAADLARLDEAANLVLQAEGEPGILRRLEDGTLNQAVTALPPAAMAIARDTRSIAAAFKWQSLAGDLLPKVAEHEIHRKTSPEGLTRSTLAKILALEDRLAIGRVAAMPAAAREVLTDAPSLDLKALARALDEAQLEALSGYLVRLGKEPAQRVLHAVSRSPELMQQLARPGVLGAIASSPDQGAAVALMLETHTFTNPMSILENLRLLTEGKINPMLFWYKDPVALAGAAFVLLALLVMLKRLVFGVRPKVVVHAPMPPRAGLRRRGEDA